MIHDYKKFTEELKLNENLFKRAWNTIFNFFKRKYKRSAWLYYGLFLKKNNELPKEKIEIYVPSSYMLDNIPTMKDIESTSESMKNVRFNIKKIYEGYVNLDHPDPNVLNLNMQELKEEIILTYRLNEDRVRKGLPRTKNHALYIWGAPGIGKTEILRWVAEELNLIVLEWHLSTIEPTEFRGLPKIENMGLDNDKADERTVNKLPALFPTDDGPNGRGGIFFFDEINRAPKMVLSASLSLCLSGKVGTYELPPHWIVVAAGNREDDLGGAVATTIEPALANRFGHVNLRPEVDEFIDFVFSKPHMNPEIAAFLKWNQDFYHQLDPDVDTPAWPSPRSWELASQQEYFVRGDDWSNDIPRRRMQMIYNKYIGTRATTAFMEYLALKKDFNENDVEDVYKKGAGAKKPPARLDQSCAAAASVAFYRKGHEIKPEELKNVLEWSLSIENIENRTTAISFLKSIHPYIRDKEPWKTIYWSHVKKWHKGLEDLD
jgi:hypothetical protein